ncbi:Hypothetical predicted protein [Podarcis lilfordi]|uniref:Uncharacterized protein n=1 Tax=Podarcis lilfordi TaxID=74358 RepID=A0AA35KIZ4_9SAUR|nr:Hypothetical predicted protein [Podarcis lilfordi]
MATYRDIRRLTRQKQHALAGWPSAAAPIAYRTTNHSRVDRMPGHGTLLAFRRSAPFIITALQTVVSQAAQTTYHPTARIGSPLPIVASKSRAETSRTTPKQQNTFDTRDPNSAPVRSASWQRHHINVIACHIKEDARNA